MPATPPPSAAENSSAMGLKLLRWLIVLLLIGGLGAGVGYLVVTRFLAEPPPVSLTLPSPSPEIRTFSHFSHDYRFVIPDNWQVGAISTDSAQLADPAIAHKVEVYDSILGPGAALVTITRFNSFADVGIPEASLAPSQWGSYPAQTRVTSNNLGSQDTFYYLEHPEYGTLEIMRRSNGEPEVERALQGIEDSFVVE